MIFEPARTSLEAGLTKCPDDPNLRGARAAWHLSRRNWREGWADYEYRLSKKLSFTHLDEMKEWRGSALLPPMTASTPPESSSPAVGSLIATPGQGTSDSAAGGRTQPTLIILGEGSAANQLMFSRYVPLALARFGVRTGPSDTKVVLCVRPELARLFEGFGLPVITSTFEFKHVVESGGEHCRWISLASLPHVLAGLVPPAPVRYQMNREDILRMAELIPPTNALRVGICWRGSVSNGADIKRRLGGRDLRPALRVPGCDYYGLQPGAGPGALPNLAAHCHDLADTAAAIENLDLVISVDSEVAHLAGAIGKPTLLLVERRSDWRWGLDSDRCDWYPAMRLFRQTDDGLWNPAIEKLVEDLAAAARVRARRPKLPPAARAGRVRSVVSEEKKERSSSVVRRPPGICSAPCRHGVMAFYETDHWVGRSLKLYGEYSEGEVELFRRIVMPGDVVVEAGANIGALTAPLAKLVGPGGLVHAIEPQQDIFELLTLNMRHLKNVKLWCRALAAKAGSIRFSTADRSLVCNPGGCEVRLTGEDQEEAAAVRLDDLIEARSISLLKADVEGMETDVLRGASEIVTRCRPLLYIEDDRPNQSTALHSWLKSHGYRIYRHTPPYYSSNNWRGYEVNVFGDTVSLNLLCVPEHRGNLGDVLELVERVA